MHLLKLAVAILAFAALTACARPTPYQAALDSSQDGYIEREIGTDQYRVGFTGNGITPRETVDRYLLYRAAELTRDKGYDYFIVANRNDYIDPQGIGGRQSQISFVRRQELLVGSGIRSRFGEEVVDHYGAEIDILMQKGEAPNEANVHKAADVITRSEKAIVRPNDPA